jgi:hypothetical protein
MNTVRADSLTAGCRMPHYPVAAKRVQESSGKLYSRGMSADPPRPFLSSLSEQPEAV